MRRCALALCLVTSAGIASAADSAPWRTPALAGLRAYHYQAIQKINGEVRGGYRVDFDLLTAGDGSIDVILRRSEQSDDAVSWSPVAVSDNCRAAMHGSPVAVATARLWPLNQQAENALGSSFLDTCAPGGVFFPLTDILNVAIIAVAPRFSASQLRHVGDVARYPGFTATYDRAGHVFKEVSPGGEVRLVSLEAGRAILSWSPEKATLELKQPGPQDREINLQGTEHFAFQVAIDTHSGTLLSASATYDDLDLAVHVEGAPEGAAPRQAISRSVEIETR